MLLVIVWTVLAIWVPSAVLTLLIFGLDERAHRRQTALPTPPQPRVAPKRTAARSLSPTAP